MSNRPVQYTIELKYCWKWR